MLVSACLLAGVGCLKPDPLGGPAEDDPPPLEDNGLRAGATSTTNWPPKAGNRYISIRTRADSAFAIAFLQNGQAATDPLLVPASLSGQAFLYRAGTIPALDEPRVATLYFADADTVRIFPAVADSLLESPADTLLFNIRIRTDDGLEAWSFGYGYVPGTGAFFKTDFSEKMEREVFLGKAEAYFKGAVDTSIATPQPFLPGNTIMCFYIPGTHFFKTLSETQVDLGPLAAGDYPLRLLRVTYSDGIAPESGLEIFEVEMTGSHTEDRPFRLAIGPHVFSRRVPGEIKLRSHP